MVISEREVNGIPSSEIRYYIGSVDGTAEEYLKTGARSLGDREFITLGVGRLFPRGRATTLGWQQCGEPVMAAQGGVVSAQGREEQ